MTDPTNYCPLCLAVLPAHEDSCIWHPEYELLVEDD